MSFFNKLLIVITDKMEVYVIVFLLSALVKVLFFPAYKSTDFEVHRNWLAITHTLPVSKWYYEDTSEWTLDYPPFFAWFEYLLSQVAAAIDPAIVQISAQPYSSWACVMFQRMSVICSEAVLCLAIAIYCRHRRHNETAKAIISLQLLCNFGLFIVDHIHFQYNGFLFGILLLSIAMMQQDRHIESAILFAVLLNFKHIFLYIAPVYFVYLLKHYCFASNKQAHSSKGKVFRPSSLLQQLQFPRLFLLGGLVIFVFSLSFGPFVAMGQLGQVIGRLFPFKRGLCHAYWAPNFWALYNIADKSLSVVAARVGLSHVVGNSTMMSGLVGETSHQILPNVSPLATVVITVIAMGPPLFKLWWFPSDSRDFLKTLVLCGYSSFLFGWHVHEKAIMMITLPMSFLAFEDKFMNRIYFVLSFAGHISLFPLLFTPSETLIKVTAFVAFTSLSFASLPLINSKGKRLNSNTTVESASFPGISLTDCMLLSMLILVQVYCLVIHDFIGFMGGFPFLPLLLTSISSAVVIIWTWLLMVINFIASDFKNKTE